MFFFHFYTKRIDLFNHLNEKKKPSNKHLHFLTSIQSIFFTSFNISHSHKLGRSQLVFLFMCSMCLSSLSLFYVIFVYTSNGRVYSFYFSSQHHACTFHCLSLFSRFTDSAPWTFALLLKKPVPNKLVQQSSSKHKVSSTSTFNLVKSFPIDHQVSCSLYLFLSLSISLSSLRLFLSPFFLSSP